MAGHTFLAECFPNKPKQALISSTPLKIILGTKRKTMKKIILTLTFIAALIAITYAEGINTDVAALNIFKVLINNYGKAEMGTERRFNKSSVMFNGHKISVYYIVGYSLVGLSYRLNENDLPEDILKSIKKRYTGCVITYTLIFMDSDSRITYYAIVKNSKRYTAMKISSGYRLLVMKKIPIK